MAKIEINEPNDGRIRLPQLEAGQWARISGDEFTGCLVCGGQNATVTNIFHSNGVPAFVDGYKVGTLLCTPLPSTSTVTFTQE